MEQIRVLIVEDRSVIAESLAATLENADYVIVAKLKSGEEVMELLERDTPDIILMDIHLSGKLDGIQTVEKVNQKHKIPVIYVTDFQDKETIDRAKHTRPAAYLLKPYQEKDLLIAVEIAFHNASKGKEASAASTEPITETIFPLGDRFFVKEKDRMVRIDISDVLWIEADRVYYNIHTVKKKFLSLVGTLKLFTEKLNHPMLLRVHRSYIVNLDKVTAIKGNLLMIDTKEIPISDQYKEDVYHRLHRI